MKEKKSSHTQEKKNDAKHKTDHLFFFVRYPSCYKYIIKKKKKGKMYKMTTQSEKKYKIQIYILKDC